jgi:hypothetical protein
LLGTGATGTVAANDGADEPNNPGRVATYNGPTTKVTPGLGGFDKVLLYLADPDPDWGGEPMTPPRFHEEIMGRSIDEVVAHRNAAREYFEETHGVVFPEVTEDTVYADLESTGDIDATFVPSTLTPAAGYTAYVMSGRAMPNNHGDDHTNTNPESAGKVRDGNWQFVLNEDAELGGTYGATGESSFEAGTSGVWGEYSIRMGDQEDPVVIHVRSRHPLDFSGRAPSAFNCEVEHEEWGEGAARGIAAGDMIGIRNILTFPDNL